MLIESLADGGVRCGLPRDLALRLAAQTTLGSAAMLKNGGHPAAMKDNVTSPAGSTAEGTYHLEQNGGYSNFSNIKLQLKYNTKILFHHTRGYGIMVCRSRFFVRRLTMYTNLF